MYISEAELLRLNKTTLAIHACTDINLFEITLLRKLQELVLYDNGGYFHPDPATRSIPSGILLDIDPQIFQNYKAMYEKIDFYLKHLFSTTILLSTERRSDHPDYPTWLKMPHFTEFYLPNKLYHMAVINVVNLGNFSGRICMYRKQSRDGFSDNEMLLFKLASMHIQAVYGNLKAAELFTDNWKKLNQSTQAICLFDQNFNCIYCNHRANMLFKQHSVHHLYSNIHEICRSFAANYYNTFYTPQYSGTLSYTRTKINYSCTSYIYHEQRYFQIVFDYHIKLILFK
ncbi:MAG: hypothetical protein H6Q73_2040 [Firmicutes bacterium]|nr:hypothetical protein [Bacillota bacterium]